MLGLNIIVVVDSVDEMVDHIWRAFDLIFVRFLPALPGLLLSLVMKR